MDGLRDIPCQEARFMVSEFIWDFLVLVLIIILANKAL